MVAHFAVRTYRVNQEFRFVKGSWLQRKNRQIRYNFRKLPISHHTCATCSDLPSYISTMNIAVIQFNLDP